MISEQIKTRLQRAGKRFHAADNISEFLHEGDREALIEELTEKFEDVIYGLSYLCKTSQKQNSTEKDLFFFSDAECSCQPYLYRPRREIKT